MILFSMRIFIILFFIFSFSAELLAASDCFHSMEMILFRSNFNNTRPKSLYDDVFSFDGGIYKQIGKKSEFIYFDDLKRIDKSMSHILDGGAGVGKMAKEWVDKSIKSKKNPPSFTLLSYELNTFDDSSISPIRVLGRRLFSDISNEEILGKKGKFDLIYDLFGIFTYDTAPDVVLRRYLDLLKDDGVIYLHTGFTSSFRITGLGESAFIKWISSFKGVSVAVEQTKVGAPSFRFARIAGEEVSIPKLKIYDYSGVPPIRMFRQID